MQLYTSLKTNSPFDLLQQLRLPFQEQQYRPVTLKGNFLLRHDNLHVGRRLAEYSFAADLIQRILEQYVKVVRFPQRLHHQHFDAAPRPLVVLVVNEADHGTALCELQRQ
jgi:hypothetical protein